MDLRARRVFRLASAPALSLAVSYGLQMPLPFIAPLFAFIFVSSTPVPMGIKQLIILVIVLMLTLGSGLLLVPLLIHYSFTAFLLVAVGIYFSTYITVNKDKALLGTLLAIGMTMISAAGTVHTAVSTLVITALIVGAVIAFICQWIVYPFFPEDSEKLKENKGEPGETSNWIAIRSVFIVMPAYFLVLTNPMMYLPIALKSVLLSQQSSTMEAKSAGKELVGSTILGGVFAVLFWFLLGLSVNLWMFFLWMLLFGIYFSAKLYQLIKTKYPPSFWVNVATTMLIMLGPAVEDSANGKDVYAAFFTRTALLVLISIYAWLAVTWFEYLRNKNRKVSHAI